MLLLICMMCQGELPYLFTAPERLDDRQRAAIRLLAARHAVVVPVVFNDRARGCPSVRFLLPGRDGAEGILDGCRWQMAGGNASVSFGSNGLVAVRGRECFGVFRYADQSYTVRPIGGGVLALILRGRPDN